MRVRVEVREVPLSTRLTWPRDSWPCSSASLSSVRAWPPQRMSRPALSPSTAATASAVAGRVTHSEETGGGGGGVPEEGVAAARAWP